MEYGVKQEQEWLWDRSDRRTISGDGSAGWTGICQSCE